MLFQTAFVALALAAQTLAQDPNFDIINRPTKDEDVPAGETYTVEWALGSSDLTGPATISLLGGADSNTLESLGVIGHVQNEDLKFNWAVNASLGTDNLYGISITLDANTTHFQYSPGFHIVAAAAKSSTGSASSVVSSSVIASTAASSTTATSSAVTSSAATSSAVTSSAPDTANTTTSFSSTSSAAVTSSFISASNSTLSSIVSTTATTKASSSSSTASATSTSSTASATSSIVVSSGSVGRHMSSAVSGTVFASFVGSIALHLLFL